ncbi:MAG TPA: AI-2E family transporter [Thermoanaerobaculia bacterium]
MTDIRSISSAAALRVTLIVCAVVVALRFLWVAHAIFMVAALGILFGLALTRAVDHLERLRIPRGLGSPLALLVIVGALVAAGALLLPRLIEQSQGLAQQVPQMLQRLNPTAKFLVTHLGRELQSAPKFLFPIVSTAAGAIAGIVLVLFISMYIAVSPRLYRDGLLHLVPHAQREQAAETFATLASTLRQWLIARLIAMVLIGAITALGLIALRIEGAIALGVLAGLLEFIPFFGPIASAIPAIGIAAAQSPEKALWVALLYLAVQQLEGNVVTPLLLKQRLDVPPVLTVVAVAALGVVFGVIGMLIAEPLTAVALVLTKLLYVEQVVGDPVTVGKE